MKFSPRVRAVARFFSLLGVGVWLGGFCLIGAAFPKFFKAGENLGIPSLGPQMVGAALGSFTPLTYVCAVLALAGWAFDPVAKAGKGYKLWRFQGIGLAAMLAMAIYAGAVVLPEIQRIQPAVLAAKAAKQTNETTKRFKKLHGLYGSTSLAILGLGLISLGCFAARSAGEADERVTV